MDALKDRQRDEREELTERHQREIELMARKQEQVGGEAGRIQDSVTNILHRDNNPYAGKTSTRRYGIDKIKSKE
jgi:hypothetical protein